MVKKHILKSNIPLEDIWFDWDGVHSKRTIQECDEIPEPPRLWIEEVDED